VTIKTIDVIAVEIATGNERIIGEASTERDAEAIIKFAIMRRGVDDEYFTWRYSDSQP
jgi:hypothetical protein